MRTRIPRRLCTAIVSTILALALLLQSACGTLLYPERRGQTSGQIDPAVAILNGIGVLFFIIPGLIAFAVDFSTGAIYLPPEEGRSSEGGQRVVRVDPDELTPERIESVIYEQTGQRVTLSEADVRALRGDQDWVTASRSRTTSGE